MSYTEFHDQRNGFWTSRSREVASWFSGSGCVPYHKGRGFESRLVQYFVVILDYGEKDGKTQYFLSTGPYFKTSKKGQKLHKFISKGQGGGGDLNRPLTGGGGLGGARRGSNSTFEAGGSVREYDHTLAESVALQGSDASSEGA